MSVYNNVKFPIHWAGVGFELNDPKDGIAAGFWQYTILLSRYDLIEYASYTPSGRYCDYRVFRNAAALIHCAENALKSDSRFGKAAYNLLDGLIKKKAGND